MVVSANARIMKNKDLSSPLTPILKYVGIPLILLCFSGVGLIMFFKTLAPIALIITIIGLIPLIIFWKLKDVSYDDKNLIIKGFHNKEIVDLRKIQRIYKIDIGLNYWIEYLDKDGNIQYADFWPRTDFIQMLSGRLPNNLDDLIKRIE